jgi:hypothetical protein
MWIKTIDKNNEYVTEYTNMDTGIRFTLELCGSLHWVFGSRFDEKIGVRTLWEGKHTEEDYSVYKSLIKKIDELLKDGVRLMDFQQIIAHIQSNEDDGKRKFIDKLEEDVKKI